MEGYSTFPKPQNWSFTIRCSVVSYPKLLLGWDYYSFEKMQSVYFTAPNEEVVFVFVFLSILPDSYFWKMIGWVLWHINLRKLFNAKFCLYTY